MTNFRRNAHRALGSLLLAVAVTFTFSSCQLLAWTLAVAMEDEYGTGSSGSGGSSTGTSGTGTSSGGTTSGGSGTSSGGSTGTSGGSSGTTTNTNAVVTLPISNKTLSWSEMLRFDKSYFVNFRSGSQIRIEASNTSNPYHMLKMYADLSSGMVALHSGRISGASVQSTGEITPAWDSGTIIYTVTAQEAANLKSAGMVLHGDGMLIRNVRLYPGGNAPAGTHSSTGSSSGSSGGSSSGTGTSSGGSTGTSSGSSGTAATTTTRVTQVSGKDLSWGEVIDLDKSYFANFRQGSQIQLTVTNTDRYSSQFKLYAPVANTGWQPLHSGTLTSNASVTGDGVVTSNVGYGNTGIITYTVTSQEAANLKNYGMKLHGGGIRVNDLTLFANGGANTAGSSGTSSGSTSGSSSGNGSSGTSSSGTSSSGTSSSGTGSGTTAYGQSTVWSGGTDLGWWTNQVAIPASQFQNARAGSTITIYTSRSPSYPNTGLYYLRLYSTLTGANALYNGSVTGATKSGDTIIASEPGATVTYTLTDSEAEKVRRDGLIIQGSSLTVTQVAFSSYGASSSAATQSQPIATAAGTPFFEHGALSVKGASLLDKNGQKYQLYGMSTHGISWYPEYISYDSFRTLRDDWNTNCVRLALYPRDYNGYANGGNQGQLRQYVYDGIDYATALGMYVIVDWHVLDYNPNETKTEAIAFFSELSAKYRSADNIIYEICNEPVNADWATQIRPYAESVIPVIRANDANAVIIVGTNTWSQDLEGPVKSPLTYKNVMYAFHFYADTHTDYMRQRLENAVRAGLPVFVTEFGTCDSSGGGTVNSYQTSQWFELLAKYGISHINWSLCNKAETASALAQWTRNTYGWSDAELSQSGALVRSHFRTLAR